MIGSGAALMIEDVFSNFSESDCYGLLSERQVQIFKNLEKSIQADLCLRRILRNSLSIKFFTDTKLLDLLIARMSSEQVEEVLSKCSLGDTENWDEYCPYDLLRVISSENPALLASILDPLIDPAFFEKEAKNIKPTVRVVPNYPLYEYQLDCCRRINALINGREARRALLHLPTGAGKTRTSINVACDYLREHPNSLVVWLADTQELCEQALEEFQKAWGSVGNHALPSYAFFRDSELSISGIERGFFVASLQKIAALNRSGNDQIKYLFQKLRQQTHLIIFDEAHKAIAPKYKFISEEFLLHSENEAFLLGLSATPGRVFTVDEKHREENRKLSAFFEYNKISMRVKTYASPIEYLYEKNYLARPDFYALDYEGVDLTAYNYAKGNLDDNQELLNHLSKNTERNSKIVDTVQYQLSQDESSQIIIFACTVEHAEELHMLISSRGIASRCIDGTTPSDIRYMSIQDYKKGRVKVLVNYGVLTTGFDAPRTNIAIIARPTSSLVLYSQMAGRAMRGSKSGGNKKCKIFTINDNIAEFKDVCKAFAHWDDLWKDED